MAQSPRVANPRSGTQHGGRRTWYAPFRDDDGRFGAAGQEEWMTFFRDPDGNLLALASRR